MLEGDVLTVAGEWGAERVLPIRGGWLGLAAPAGKTHALDWDR